LIFVGFIGGLLVLVLQVQFVQLGGGDLVQWVILLTNARQVSKLAICVRGRGSREGRIRERELEQDLA
jgi:hypothetical protein